MIVLITGILCIGIIISALLAILMRNVVSAAICAGLASLFASVTYVSMAAPDVAMTEAAIGSGLTTIIFLFTVRKTKERRGK